MPVGGIVRPLASNPTVAAKPEPGDSEPGSSSSNSIMATGPAEAPTPVQDPDIWFEDGNVVVIAQNTAFRFHRGTLCRHSEVFRGMFSIPQPASLEDELEVTYGCPVIHVSDTACDFKRMLHAIYDGMWYVSSDIAPCIQHSHSTQFLTTSPTG